MLARRPASMLASSGGGMPPTPATFTSERRAQCSGSRRLARCRAAARDAANEDLVVLKSVDSATSTPFERDDRDAEQRDLTRPVM